jgi:hypothetical protein
MLRLSDRSGATSESEWPLLLAAVRDELLDRPWDPPAAHWPATPEVQGGRDRTAGGTWLAVDRGRGVVAAVLNGARRPEPAPGEARPSRGYLPFAALAAATPIDSAGVVDYDGFHLFRGDRNGAEVWSWNGVDLVHQVLAPGDHIIVNLGPDCADDPLVPHFMPLLNATPDPDPRPGLPPAKAWDGWLDLLRGDDLSPTDTRGLLIEHHVNGVHYGSSSASLVAIGASGEVRYDFTSTPRTPHWAEIPRPRLQAMSD